MQSPTIQYYVSKDNRTLIRSLNGVITSVNKRKVAFIRDEKYNGVVLREWCNVILIKYDV